MNLGQKAVKSLEKWGAFKDDRRSLSVEGGKLAIVAQVTAADNLSCLLSDLRLNLHNDRSLSADQLEAWGNRVAKRVRYLLEAIETVEFDAPNGRLLLRSTPPEKKSDGTVLYYELRLEATGYLSLERRRFDPNNRTRLAEPMHCTRELIEKLFNDLEATIPQLQGPVSRS
jgi:hypothetical protein